MLGFSIVFSQIICEVTKQTSNYSLQYVLSGAYPVPQTIIVVVNEIIKLVATILRAIGKHQQTLIRDVNKDQNL